jgi:ADP-heptose:LPS heptosyltransferase
VLVGAESDRARCAQIADGLRERGVAPVTLAGGTDLRQAAGVIGRARLFVGCDSGLAHLATALGVRTVVLFGPTDHEKWAVQNTRHAVVHRDLPCAPCFIFGYHKPCRNLACMREITVQDVADACRRVLTAPH